ncbi:hypothetical protein [Faucicola boevrei]|uniref:hypothetical protein n=1 Tax=Faucicola boevrei TaxID=346665 RepID=UPI00058CCC18|nr:hypothetical protein [Moraxella boevrei]
MKKLLMTSLLLVATMSHAKTNETERATNTVPKTFEGCISALDESSRNPEGSSQVCFFKNGKFLGAGFGFLKFGNYQIKQDTIDMAFMRPEMFEVTSTYDPQQKGVYIQFDGFDNTDALVSFDKQNFQPIFNGSPNCISYPSFKTLPSVKTIQLFSHLQGKDYVWEYQLPQKNNRIIINYLDADDDVYTPTSVPFLYKNNKVFLLDYDGKPSHVVKALNKNDKEILEFKALSSKMDSDTQPTSVLRNEFNDFPDDTKYYQYNEKLNTYSLKTQFYDEMGEIAYDNSDGRLDTIRRYTFLESTKTPMSLDDLSISKKALFFAKCDHDINTTH